MADERSDAVLSSAAFRIRGWGTKPAQDRRLKLSVPNRIDVNAYRIADHQEPVAALEN